MTSMRTVTRRLTTPLIALFVAALAVIVPQACAACSCAIMDFDESVAMAGAVFSGTVVERVDPHAGPQVSSGDLIEYTVEVDTVYAGEVPATTLVKSARDSASCGIDLVPGTTYLFLTDRGSTTMVGLCGGTAELGLITDDQLAVLGEGSAPVAAPGAEGSAGGSPGVENVSSQNDHGAQSGAGTLGATGSNAALVWGLGVVGIAAVALFGAIWWPRRSER